VIARFIDKAPASGGGLLARAQALGLHPAAGAEGRNMLLGLPENLDRMYQALVSPPRPPLPTTSPRLPISSFAASTTP